MRTFVAIVLGLLSSVVLVLLAALLIDAITSADLSLVGASGGLLAGWLISSYFIRRNAATTSAVLCRGFLLGAAEWLAVIPATRASPRDYQNVPNSVPVVVGEILIRLLGGTMAAGCLIAFAIARFVRRQTPAG